MNIDKFNRAKILVREIAYYKKTIEEAIKASEDEEYMRTMSLKWGIDVLYSGSIPIPETLAKSFLDQVLVEQLVKLRVLELEFKNI